MTSRTSHYDPTAAAEARAALEALFGGASLPSPNASVLPLEGKSLIAAKLANGNALSGKVERLRRKREALAEVRRAAAAAGFTLEEIREALPG